MNKKELLHSLLSELSTAELTNALRVLKTLSQHNLLQAKHIDALLRVADEMNISSPNFVPSVIVTTSGELGADVLSGLFSKDKNITIQEQESEDVFVNVRSGSVSYKRSLNQDVDKLLA